ncbi:uncharacterized protein LOC106718281 [Papilio machaon]|uniref:uncharacterized protein LOC106718281 n=1 Tax=Papilio machaon TaxID=76193 RepID=UPI001E663FFF|nr:uncharacterized protein LOC106718281 [Papilio machaon]
MLSSCRTGKSYSKEEDKEVIITQNAAGSNNAELFVGLTIAQSDGNPKSCEILRPINEKLAIKKFADGLRNRRLSTIISARDYSELKDAVRAAEDEELGQPSSPYNIFNAQRKDYHICSLKPEIEKQIKQMLDEDIIEPSQSEWSSPILLVPKKSDDKNNKKWRLVIDYRKLNDVIQDDKFPLPNITEILDSLSGAIYYTHLDLSQSYYQCSLKPESRPITSFTTGTGQYQMKRLPMGLKISPSAFSRVMSVAMSGLNYVNCFIYLDDCICFGRNLESHNKNLIEIFERLRKVNLKLNPSKCQFLKTELLYLGHTISSKGIQPDLDKIKTIQNYPTPTNVDEVRRFVAMCNYYRKFINNFADITNCLNKLCKKNVKYEWTEQCDKSFNILKNALINPPILQYPDFSKEFILQTDASGTAIGAVLCNNNMRVVAYTSRPLNKAELNYPTITERVIRYSLECKIFQTILIWTYFYYHDRP